MRTYAFETRDGFRFDVKASSIKSAVSKVESIPYLSDMATGYYYMYDEDGLHYNASGWDGNYKRKEGIQ